MRQFRPCKLFLRSIQVLSAVIGVLLFWCISYAVSSLKAVAVSLAVIAAIVFLTAFVYAPLYFSSMRFTVSGQELTSKRGVFIKREQSIKFSSVQYTTVIRFSISRDRSLSSVIFFVYGGKLKVSFLSADDMKALLRLYEKEK